MAPAHDRVAKGRLFSDQPGLCMRFSPSTLALASALLLAAPAVLAAPVASPAASRADRVVLPADAVPLAYALTVAPDARAMTFAGEVAIEIEVRRATRMLEINAADLTFQNTSLDGAPASAVRFDAEQQTATLSFAHAIAPGRHRLLIRYTGKINQHAAGLFALDYDAPASVGGGRRRALFTQFENSDARRFVPSWDEPNRKATFQLTVVVPTDQMAVSNMPVASTAPARAGLQRVTFQRTPKMSSYLLFFGLGDFERIHREVDGVDVGVVVKRGAGEQGRYALDAAANILRYYNDYFGVKYPLPKLDMIAGSGQSQFFGAMENWGAIFYFDRDVLIDPKLSTQGDRQNVYIVVAHEMAHQWFGDLVTMDWWDDLWLNEGFASWMENKAVDHFHPEWKLWLQAAASKEGAMALDARTGTHPIIQPIKDVLQAQQAFDAITYQKGEAVIRMLEQYVGPDNWRDGVRRYIRAHAYGNTTTDDLWREVDAVSPRKITDIAHDFTLQPGVPLVTVTSGCDGATATMGRLAESRFGLDQPSKAPLSWRIPVAVKALDGRSANETVVTPQEGAFRLGGCTSAVVNAGQTGYFRTEYAPAAFAPIKAAYARLDPYDQLGVLNDAAALGGAGYQPYADTLDLVAALPVDADPVVAQEAVDRITAVDEIMRDAPELAAWRGRARELLRPLHAKLGWAPRAGESDNTALLRQAVLRALSEVDDAQVIAEARARFADAGREGGLDPATRRTVLAIVALHATPAEWDALHALARRAPTALEKADAYFRLGRARDPALARRALELALTDEPDATTTPSIITDVGLEHPRMALDFAIAHIDRINVVLEPDSRAAFIPRVAQEDDDLAVLPVLDAYAAAHIPPSAQGDVVRARSAIRAAAERRARVRPQVAAWLASHPG